MVRKKQPGGTEVQEEVAPITGKILIQTEFSIKDEFIGLRLYFLFFSGCIVNIAFALLLLGELVIWIKVRINLRSLFKSKFKSLLSIGNCLKY